MVETRRPCDLFVARPGEWVPVRRSPSCSPSPKLEPQSAQDAAPTAAVRFGARPLSLGVVDLLARRGSSPDYLPGRGLSLTEAGWSSRQSSRKRNSSPGLRGIFGDVGLIATLKQPLDPQVPDDIGLQHRRRVSPERWSERKQKCVIPESVDPMMVNTLFAASGQRLRAGKHHTRSYGVEGVLAGTADCPEEVIAREMGMYRKGRGSPRAQRISVRVPAPYDTARKEPFIDTASTSRESLSCKQWRFNKTTSGSPSPCGVRFVSTLPPFLRVADTSLDVDSTNALGGGLASVARSRLQDGLLKAS